VSGGPPPRRVRITHPRTEAARSVAIRPASREIDEQTALGEVYMSALIRTQRRLAIIVCATIATLLIGVALLGAFSSRFATIRWLGVPLPWLVLGVLVYPALIALAAYTVRQAERNEQAFTELVRRR
jgi:hypothetical protein